MSDIIYPTGCRALSEDLGTDELIRRLKTLAHTLQAMNQDDGSFQQYIPLALHLVDENYLQHDSRDVQLLIACCIADILRVYAPEAPYKDQDQIKTIFMFFITQMSGLKDPKDPSFNRYFYLLENLAYVKSFNMCFEIEDSQEIFHQLFSMIFRIINENHSCKVKNFMIDILSALITDADNFTPDLLDIILINIVEPSKSSCKSAYELAEQLIRKTSNSLEPVIKMFFNQVLVLDKIDKNCAISYKVYELIYELNLIDPGILAATLPQLECKLRSTTKSERLHVPGDNDIGGENGEYISNSNVRRFEFEFTHNNELFEYENRVRFFKINRMLLDFTNPDRANNANRLRIAISHAPILIGGGPLLRSVLSELDPHVLFSAHWHESRIFVHPSSKVVNFYENSVRHFDLKSLKLIDHSYLEIMVPTASYRMGKTKIGLGFAVLENYNLTYTVLWLPNRFIILFSYLFWMIFALCGFFVFKMMTRCPFRVAKRQTTHYSRVSSIPPQF